jgi:hypothetical protein
MKLIRKLLRNILFSVGIIYGLDLLLDGVNIFIPINIFTVLISSILGIPGILALYSIFFIIN